MPLPSSEPSVVTPTSHIHDDGPVLEHAAPATEVANQLLRIRARRLYQASRDELFAAWIRRGAWDAWMRLRARSRTTLAPYAGGAFRLELADGPTIHVITGILTEVRPPELLSLGWVHHSAGGQGSTIDLSFRELGAWTDFRLVHRSISSRREAAWLMRLWTAVLGRLGSYVAEGASGSDRRVPEIPRRIQHATEPRPGRTRVSGTFARSA